MEIVHVEAAQQWQRNRLSGDAGRPRVADDFEAIRARVEELRRERERAYLTVLPSFDTKRWVASRKAAVVIAVREGMISRGKACDWYQLSSEELASWEVAFKRSGAIGLRARYRFPEIRRKTAPGGYVEPRCVRARPAAYAKAQGLADAEIFDRERIRLFLDGPDGLSVLSDPAIHAEVQMAGET